jgi:hypothetical protein
MDNGRKIMFEMVIMFFLSEEEILLVMWEDHLATLG